MDFNWDMNRFGTMTAPPLLSEQTGQWNVEPGASWTFLTAEITSEQGSPSGKLT